MCSYLSSYEAVQNKLCNLGSDRCGFCTDDGSCAIGRNPCWDSSDPEGEEASAADGEWEEE